MDDEDIRLPDSVVTERLISNYDMFDENDEFLNYEMNKAIEESRIEYENKLKQEQYKEHLCKLFEKLDIQINYLLLQKDDYIAYFVECFNIEKKYFLDQNRNNIYLFHSHYLYLKNLLEEIYTKPKLVNKNPKIDYELYELLNNILKKY